MKEYKYYNKEESLKDWDRLPDETEQQYECFKVYLSIPSGKRSLFLAWCMVEDITVEEGLKLTGGARRAPALFEKLAAKNKWNDRCKAFDNYVRSAHGQEQLPGSVAVREAAQFREQTKAAARKLYETSLLLLDKYKERIQQLDPSELQPRLLAPGLKQLADTIALANDQHATALGINEIIYYLETKDGEQE